MTYAALGHGAKGIKYYDAGVRGGKAGTYYGFLSPSSSTDTGNLGIFALRLA
jgi:hypothetical protein